MCLRSGAAEVFHLRCEIVQFLVPAKNTAAQLAQAFCVSAYLPHPLVIMGGLDRLAGCCAAA